MKDKPKCDLRQVVLLRHGESVLEQGKPLYRLDGR